MSIRIRLTDILILSSHAFAGYELFGEERASCTDGESWPELEELPQCAINMARFEYFLISHEYCLPQCANYIESPTGNQIQSVLSFPPHCEVHRPHYDTQDTPEWYSPWINSAKGFSIRATHTRENHEVWGKISRICRRVVQFIQACAITAQT